MITYHPPRKTASLKNCDKKSYLVARCCDAKFIFLADAASFSMSLGWTTLHFGLLVKPEIWMYFCALTKKFESN
jgi:hypothetical protein